jgi:hypothetical protein
MLKHTLGHLPGLVAALKGFNNVEDQNSLLRTAILNLSSPVFEEMQTNISGMPQLIYNLRVILFD